MDSDVQESLVTARAAVVVYDDVIRRWNPTVTSSPGVSLVQIYRRGVVEPTYRIVARHIDTQQVTLNSDVSGVICYNMSTSTFHQWYDSSRTIYGLNFVSVLEADSFARSVSNVVRLINQSRRSNAGHDVIAETDHHYSLSSLSRRQRSDKSTHLQQVTCSSQLEPLTDDCRGFPAADGDTTMTSRTETPPMTSSSRRPISKLDLQALKSDLRAGLREELRRMCDDVKLVIADMYDGQAARGDVIRRDDVMM